MIIITFMICDYYDGYQERLSCYLRFMIIVMVIMLFQIYDYCDGYQVDRPSPGCPGWREEFRRLAVRVPAVQVRSVFLVQVF